MKVNVFVMKRNAFAGKCRGAAILIVTTVLLLVSQVMIFGVSKGTLSGFKRQQDFILASQEHWVAEAGLECVLSQVQLYSGVPDEIKFCGLPESLSIDVIAHGADRISVHSNYLNATLSQTLKREVQGAVFLWHWEAGSWRDF